MLSNDDRVRIEDEETLRHETRARIDAAVAAAKPTPAPPKKVFSTKLLEFFNSTLGMWLLSSVLLSGGAALIQQIQHSHENAQKTREQLIMHRFEIENRIDNMQHMLRHAKTAGQARAALDGLFKSHFPLTPELQNRSLGSLYLTIFQLVEGSAEDKATKTMKFIHELEDAEYLLQSRPDDDPIDAKEKAQFNKLIRSIKDMHFNTTS